MFIFMNPTAGNVSTHPKWNGLRAPWVGINNIWKMFCLLGLLSPATNKKIQTLRSKEWDEKFTLSLYQELTRRKIYISDLAKCTMKDARPLSNRIFQEYLSNTRKEISLVRPRKIISFGNQVSSILLGWPVRVGDYRNQEGEWLKIGNQTFPFYLVYYPVGQGQRNLPLAIRRIGSIIKKR